jgi:hypothetical protein
MDNRPKAGEFFHLEPDVRRGGRGHGVVFENEEALLSPPRLILKQKMADFLCYGKFHDWFITPAKAYRLRIWKAG